MKKKIAICILIILLALLATGRPYGSFNGYHRAGIAWDFGGVEIAGTPGVFLCSSPFIPNSAFTVDC